MFGCEMEYCTYLNSADSEAVFRNGFVVKQITPDSPVRHTKSQRNSRRDHLNFFSAVLSKYQCHVSKICDLFPLFLRRHPSTRTPYLSYG